MTDLDLYSELLEEDSGSANCPPQPKSLLEQVCLLQSKCAELETELETMSAHLSRSETHRFQLISLNDRILDNFARLGLACRREIHKMKTRIQWLCTKANVSQAKFIEAAQTHSDPPVKALNPEAPLLYSHIVQFLHSFHLPERTAKAVTTETVSVPSTDLCLSQVLAAHLKRDKFCQLRPTRRDLLLNTQSISSLSTEGSHSSHSRSSSSSGSSSSSSSTSQNAVRKSDIGKPKKAVSEKDRCHASQPHISRRPQSGLDQRPVHASCAGRQDISKRLVATNTEVNTRFSDRTQRTTKDSHRSDAPRRSETSRADPRPDKFLNPRGRIDDSSPRFSNRTRSKEPAPSRYTKGTGGTSRHDEPRSRTVRNLAVDSRTKSVVGSSIDRRVSDRKMSDSVAHHMEDQNIAVTQAHHDSAETANTKQWTEADVSASQGHDSHPVVPNVNNDEVNGSDVDKAHCTVYTKRLLSRLKESDHSSAMASPTQPSSLEEHLLPTKDVMAEVGALQDLIVPSNNGGVASLVHTQSSLFETADTSNSTEPPNLSNDASTSSTLIYTKPASQVPHLSSLSPFHSISSKPEISDPTDVTDQSCIVVGGDTALPSIASEVELISTEPDQRTSSSCDEPEVRRGSPSADDEHHPKSPEDDELSESSSPDEEGEVGDDVDEEEELDDRANGPIGTPLSYGKRRRLSPRCLDSKASRNSDGSGSVKSAHKRRNISAFGSPPLTDCVIKGGSGRMSGGADESRSRHAAHDSKSSSFGRDMAPDPIHRQISLSPRDVRRYRENSRLISPQRSGSVKQSESSSSEKPHQSRVLGRQSSFESKQKGLRYNRSRSPNHSASSVRHSSSLRSYESRGPDFNRLNRKSLCSIRSNRRSPPHSHSISNTRRLPRSRPDPVRDARFRRSRPLSPPGCANRPSLVHPLHHGSTRPKIGGGFQRRHF